MANNFTTMNIKNEISRKLSIISAVTGISKSEIIESLIESNSKYRDILKVMKN